MQLPTRLGTDEAGYIINQTSRMRIQVMYRPVIDEVIGLLKKQFGEVLHSVYVYGSIGRGTAVAGKSDLDLTVIVKETVHIDALREETEDLLERHPEIIKVDYDIGILDTVLSPENLYEWGFWIRHVCSCIDGFDLSDQFPDMKPDVRISRALNRDLSVQLRMAHEKLEAGEMTRIGKRSLVKRMIRGAYLHVNVKDQSFASTIEDSLSILRLYFPENILIEDLAKSTDKMELSDEWLRELLHRYALTFV
ncbi:MULTISPECIES: nucleotidyltransferase domain-containing protein [Exiguobacterium]|uniref:nucleotidyltransferase domain-containing protein n=1 Tax=Exiguobacterium TaxID=33986 RepID=UPI001BEC2437|nr:MULTISPECIES: nucleotidyltransferase domain-containing protein [Exiguobacterium]MCT4793126.1 nucleotidyltransferase domain-containing protein [Exiguobacterium artemiae]